MCMCRLAHVPTVLSKAQGMDNLLKALQVQMLVIPSVPSAAGMWQRRFAFAAATKQEAEALEDRIVLPDPAYTSLLKRRTNLG